jgi:negative regulator of replication initiation
MGGHQRFVAVLGQLHHLDRHAFAVCLEFFNAGLGNFCLDRTTQALLFVGVQALGPALP